MNYNLIKSKRGIVFLFSVFLFSILIFAILNYHLFNNYYSKNNGYISLRIQDVDNELYYFKTNYLKNSISYSLYNTLLQLENFTKGSNYYLIDHNYSRLNNLVLEGMINGSFNGVKQDFLLGKLDGKNKTMTYFLKNYTAYFDKNFKANLSVKLKKLNLYEKNPYYVSAQFIIDFNLTTQDNISEWNSEENYFVSVPIRYLPIFEFERYDNITVPLRSSEYFLPQNNWNITYFKEVLNDTYVSHFIEKKHKYSVGSSFLKRLLNYSTGSFKNVTAFWNFDYDKDYNYQIYDTSLHNNYSKRIGNSIIMFNFNNNTMNTTQVNDLSNYYNNGLLNNVVNDTGGPVEDYAKFLTQNSNIKINNLNLDTGQISLSFWVKLNSSITGDVTILDTNQHQIWLRADNNGTILIYLNCSNSSINYLPIKSSINLTKDEWHNFCLTYDENNGLYLYIDGLLNFNEYSSKVHYFSGKFRQNIDQVILGNSIYLNESFEGGLDEFGLYKKIISPLHISELFRKKSVFDIDYFKSLYGKSLYFDGTDDYAILSNLSIYNFNNKRNTVAVWFKMNNLTGFQTLIDKGDASKGWGVFINNSYVVIGDHGSGTAKSVLPIVNSTDEYYYLVVEGFDGNKPKVWINNKVCDMTGSWPSSPGSTINVTLGKSSYNNADYFNGLLDEVRILNRTLSSSEVEANYFNYNEFGKGCCNYVILMNANKFGYNKTIYDKNVSYSVKLFYDYYKKGIAHNLTLFNLTTVTSNELDKEYYNFLFDDCINYVFSVSDFQTNSNNISMDIAHIGEDSASCSNIISMGVY